MAKIHDVRILDGRVFEKFIHKQRVDSVYVTRPRNPALRNIKFGLKPNIEPFPNRSTKTVDHLKHTRDHSNRHDQPGNRQTMPARSVSETTAGQPGDGPLAKGTQPAGEQNEHLAGKKSRAENPCTGREKPADRHFRASLHQVRRRQKSQCPETEEEDSGLGVPQPSETG